VTTASSAPTASLRDGASATLNPLPTFIPLALWVGGIVIFMVLRPLSRRALASTASSRTVTFAG
jgi:putative membrane protein